MRASSPFLLMRAIAAHALPHTPTITDLKKRDNETGSSLGISGNVHGGEPPSGRTIYTLFVVFAMMIVAFLFGSHFHKLRRSVFMKRNLMSALVLLLYIFVLLFIILSAVLVVGQGMRNRELCVAATWVCLVFYVAAKAVIYIFLVERIHVVRAPFVRRSRDWIYLTCLVLVLVSFTGVTIGAFLTPVIHMGASDGRCHTGIPGKASIPFVVVDVLIDVILTGVFIYLLRPVMKMQGRGTISEMLRSKGPTSKTESRDTAVQRNIRTLLWKSLVGSILIMIPTAANMIQFLITAGKELALICLSICVLDACWDVVVIHWLTSGSAAEAEKSLLQSTLVSSNPPISKRSSTTAKTLFTEERESHPATRTMPEEPQEISRAYTSVLLTPDIRIESMPDLILPRVSDDSQDLETRNIFKDRP